MEENKTNSMKMNNQETSSRGGVSSIGLLGVAFVILKLTHVITWSWWLVTLPFWGGLAALLFIFLIALVVMILK